MISQASRIDDWIRQTQISEETRDFLEKDISFQKESSRWKEIESRWIAWFSQQGFLSADYDVQINIMRAFEDLLRDMNKRVEILMDSPEGEEMVSEIIRKNEKK